MPPPPPATTLPLSPALAADVRAQFVTFCTELLPEDKDKIGWQKESDPAPGVTLWSRSVPGCALLQFKAQGLVPGTPDDVKAALWGGATRMTWDSSYACADDLITFEHGLGDDVEVRLARIGIKRVLTIAPRDFSNLQVGRRRPVATWLVGNR